MLKYGTRGVYIDPVTKAERACTVINPAERGEYVEKVTVIDPETEEERHLTDHVGVLGVLVQLDDTKDVVFAAVFGVSKPGCFLEV